jgi:hypothetical protein
MGSIVDALFAQADMRCTKCNAKMGECDCWTRYTARLVKTEGGWEARLEQAHGKNAIVWPYKRLHAAKNKIAQWAAKGYEVEE